MRTLIATALLAGLSLTAFVSPSAAGHEPYPWCAIYSGGRDGGGTNCGFVTLAQCRATISGIGGTCAENPMYPGEPMQVPRKHKRHYHG